MTKKELDEYLGRKVEVIFKDNTVAKGVLGFTPEFSAKYGYRRPNYYTVDIYDFKVSHIKKIIIL